MKRIIINCLQKIVENIYHILCKLKITTPSIIVMIDGGLCSQMHQYMMGQILKSKGLKVEYDLSFFKKGLDLNGKRTRIYLLDKLFPLIDCNIANTIKKNVYKRCFMNYGKHPKVYDESWLKKLPPVYLGGYYSDTKDMYCKGGVFSQIFKIDETILTSSMRSVLAKIKETQSVGIHIRRGDLSDYNVVYGYPVTIDYLRDSIKLFFNRYATPVFYFFSDDSDYVQNKVIPFLGFKINYWISNSGFETVYEDFVLLSNCKDLITSKGTMGKYAALYNNAENVVISKDDNQYYIINGNCNIIKI